MTENLLVALVIAVAVLYVVRRGWALLGSCAGKGSAGCHGCPGACSSVMRPEGAAGDKPPPY